MSTTLQIMANVAALLNDQVRAIFTDEIQLPYFNMALQELQETYELNNVPVTDVTSAVISVPAGTTEIGFLIGSPSPSTPYLPADLIDIQELWESVTGLNNFFPMRRLNFLPHDAEVDAPISQFLIWTWMEQKIKVIAANADIDLKIDYIKSLFAPITELTWGAELGIINIDSYMQYKVAALCAMFIGENPMRAEVLNQQAEIAMTRVLGIANKGEQMIFTRRLPFRLGYKTIGRAW